MPSMPDSPSSSDPQQKLRDFKPSKEFFVGIDSDGCVFNSMEVKHNDSFSVNLIKYFGLQALSRQVHQAWDFVNLYSQTRGVNRFKAIPLVLDQMRDMPRVKKSGARLPELTYLRQWIKSETQLGNPKLKEKIAGASGPEKAELEQVLEWSKAVNKTVHGDRPQPAAVPEGARVPGQAARAGGHPGGVGHAAGGAGPGVGRTRHRQVRGVHRRAGDGVEDRAPHPGGQGQVPEREHPDGRGRARRLQGGPRRVGAVLSGEPGRRGGELGALPRRGHRQVLRQAIRRGLREQAAGGVRPPAAQGSPLEADDIERFEPGRHWHGRAGGHGPEPGPEHRRPRVSRGRLEPGGRRHRQVRR